MSIADAPETTTPADDSRRLATADTIVSIVAESDGRLGRVPPKYTFLVTVSDGRGAFTARLEGKELITYDKCRQALLAKFCCWFSSDTYEGRLAKRNWSEDIAILMRGSGQ